MTWIWIGGENLTNLWAKMTTKLSGIIYFYRGEWVLVVFDNTTWVHPQVHRSSHQKLAHAVAEARRVAANNEGA